MDSTTLLVPSMKMQKHIIRIDDNRRGIPPSNVKSLFDFGHVKPHEAEAQATFSTFGHGLERFMACFGQSVVEEGAVARVVLDIPPGESTRDNILSACTGGGISEEYNFYFNDEPVTSVLCTMTCCK